MEFVGWVSTIVGCHKVNIGWQIWGVLPHRLHIFGNGVFGPPLIERHWQVHDPRRKDLISCLPTAAGLYQQAVSHIPHVRLMWGP
jgi:hypothetical protein